MALRHHGYEALNAAGPSAALEIVRAAAIPIDLLLSDVVMPEMRGPELAREISRLSPSTGVVFMSGYAPPEGLPEGAEFLSKPFTLAQLAEKVGRALGRA
jgi:two-component system, cell cycle sensor histidine kinase and response regulator CckA